MNIRPRSPLQGTKSLASPELWFTRCDGSLRPAPRDPRFASRRPVREKMDDALAIAAMGLLSACGSVIGWAVFS
jgi:hypothetical protein